MSGSISEKNPNTLLCNNCKTEFDTSHDVLRLAPKELGEFKDIEKDFWNHRYKDQKISYNPERDEHFHTNFKKPLIDLPKNAHVLEVASGWRLDGLEIALAGKHITAIDLSEEAMPICKSLAKQAGVADKFTYATADAANLPFKDNTFDGAFIAASIHHLPDPLIALKEMARVVKPGSPVVLGVEPNRWPYYSVYPILAPLKWVIRKIRKRPYDSIADDQTKGFTIKTFTKLYNDAGLNLEETQRVKYVEEFYDKILQLQKLFRIAPPDSDKSGLESVREFDKKVSEIPGIRTLNWHWNAVGRKPKK